MTEQPENPATQRGFLFGDLSEPTPQIMGIVNVTPDSFSDGGDFSETEAAINHGMKLWADGAHILDVGGESTRPGAAPVTPEEELARVLPVVEALVGRGTLVSVDTRNASTMAAVINAGAQVINDVTALTHDPEALQVVANSSASVVLMHMIGEPGTMQDAPQYDDVVQEVYGYLEERIEACVSAGISKNRIAVDPGIGFGKTDDHNLALMQNLARFGELGCAVLLGISRKSMIGRLAGVENPKNREAGTVALNLAGLEQGVQLFRVHDVAGAKQAFTMWSLLKN